MKGVKKIKFIREERIIENENFGSVRASIAFLIMEKIVKYIANGFLVLVIVALLTSFLFLYTGFFQNNHFLNSQIFKAREESLTFGMPEIKKGIAVFAFLLMLIEEVFNIILKKLGKKPIVVSTIKKIIISLVVIIPVQILAIISVSFNGGVGADEKVSFYVFFVVVMFITIFCDLFYFLISKISQFIENYRKKNYGEKIFF